jgi:hypothetical protein
MTIDLRAYWDRQIAQAESPQHAERLRQTSAAILASQDMADASAERGAAEASAVDIASRLIRRGNSARSPSPTSASNLETHTMPMTLDQAQAAHEARYLDSLQPQQRALLERLDRRGASATRATMVGSELTLAPMDEAAARQRMLELAEQGVGAPRVDATAVMNKTFTSVPLSGRVR